jgi:16S rRNA (cytidine1402-2'-O)-methyltransferase
MERSLSSLNGENIIYHNLPGGKRRKCHNSMEKSTFYLVPTPIGNLKDITIRALDILKAVDIIACEDTRHTKKLLTHYGISRPLFSCERFSEARRMQYIIDQLEKGKSIALVSDAGTPAISDPGARLVARIRARGIRVEALPGPSALITALSASGYEPPFRFLGFLPRGAEARSKELMRMKATGDVTVFYESPRRLLSTLKAMLEIMPDREICVARELTKIHEEYIVGILSDVVPRLETSEIKGEVTVMVRGDSSGEALDRGSLERRAVMLMNTGYSRKDTLSLLCQETGVGRNEIYEMLIHLKKD